MGVRRLPDDGRKSRVATSFHAKPFTLRIQPDTFMLSVEQIKSLADAGLALEILTRDETIQVKATKPSGAATTIRLLD